MWRTPWLVGVALLWGGGGLVASAVVAAASPAPAGVPLVSLTQSFPHGYVETTLAPGQAFTTTLDVADSGSAAATFLVTAVDGYTSPASGVVYGNRARALRDGPAGNGEYGAGSWIALSASQLSLSPGQSAPLQLTVTVPASASPGDWVGGVTVENPQATSNGASSGPQLAITEASEMAVVVHVPGPTNAGVLELGQPSIVVEGVQQFLDIPLKYTGDVLVKPVYSFVIRDSSGKVVYSHSGRFDTFVPHTTITYQVRLLPVLPAGTYTFVGSTGPPGGPSQHAYNLTVTGTPPPLPTSHSGGDAGGAEVNGFVIGGGVVALTGIGLFAFLMRRSRNRCSHCGAGRIGALMTVADFNELAHCRDCRRRALDRETVRLCPECYRGHVIPGSELKPSTT